MKNDFEKEIGEWSNVILFLCGGFFFKLLGLFFIYRDYKKDQLK